MLQRAASNAYSWWWASHVRTNQSRWLDNDLQEMEDRVKAMVKVIEEDGDTFAKKAELYFQKRPELLTYVEETYRSYRGLADRYDHVSRELHKANHTIAQAFPDQVQLAIQDDRDTDRGGYPKAITVDASSKPVTPQIEIPKPSGPDDSLRRKPRHKRIASHVNKEKAREEIDRLQKEILGLQTEKEFVKSAYESSVVKFWDIEGQINDLQEEVTSLQDMFSTSAVIEDDEARALMAARAIKSCEDTLVNLQQLQQKSSEEARLESRRIKEAKRRIRFLKGECGELEPFKEDEEEKEEGEIKSGLKEATMELQVICQKVRDHFAKGSEDSVVELAERIDELVEKVISLELTVSSQGGQIKRLRNDTDELQKYLRNLEEENKGANSGDSDQFKEKIKQAEEDLQRIQQLERCLKDEKGLIQTHFTEAFSSFADLSDQLNSPKGKNAISEFDSHSTVTDAETGVDSTVLQFLIGLEGKDSKNVMDILRNCKDTRKMVLEIDRKNQEYHHETMAQVKELKSANQMKDDEIRALRQTLSSLKANFSSVGNNNNNNNNDNNNNEGENLDLHNIDGIMEQCQVKHNDHGNSDLEIKLRGDIDTLLEENLDFWLRFSTSYHQIQNFQSSFEELRNETDKIKDLSSEFSVGNEESTPVEKRLRELNTDLQVWLEKNHILKAELENRSDSLYKLKEEISRISNELDSTQFTPYQTAKFQGEISNMQQENNKVAKELKTGLDHVRNLQVDIGKELLKLRQSFEIAHSSRSSTSSHNNLHHHFRNLSTKARIPLRTFLFGTKPKKPSIFSCMNPALQKQYSDLRAAPGFHT